MKYTYTGWVFCYKKNMLDFYHTDSFGVRLSSIFDANKWRTPEIAVSQLEIDLHNNTQYKVDDFELVEIELEGRLMKGYK